MYKLILADSTEITGFTINGSNFVHATQVDESLFENNLSTLTIVDVDGVSPTVVIRDAKLIQQVTYPDQDGYFLSFTSKYSNSALASSIASDYSSSSTYTKGSFVLYSRNLYECNTAITTPENWTPSHWTLTNVGAKLSDIVSDLDSETASRQSADSSLATRINTSIKNLAPNYSSSSTYAVGYYVTYNDQLYKCSTAITTPEAWTIGHWTQVTNSSEILTIQQNLHNLISVSDSTLVFTTV